MVSTVSASLGVEELLAVVLASAPRLRSQERRAGHEMLHDGAEDGGLQVLPLAVGLGHGDEVVAEEDAGDARHREQALGERRGAPRLVGSRASKVPSGMTTRPGRNFRVAGFGVASVWMNMVVSSSDAGSRPAERVRSRIAPALESF